MFAFDAVIEHHHALFGKHPIHDRKYLLLLIDRDVVVDGEKTVIIWISPHLFRSVHSRHHGHRAADVGKALAAHGERFHEIENPLSHGIGGVIGHHARHAVDEIVFHYRLRGGSGVIGIDESLIVHIRNP